MYTKISLLQCETFDVKLFPKIAAIYLQTHEIYMTLSKILPKFIVFVI